MQAQSASIPSKRSRNIPSLDGLRALSILLVIALHSVQRYSMTHKMPPSIVYALANGALGVFIFFVISGYLITSLLLREEESTGHIGLGLFYFRRAFRILPPLYTYIFAMAALGWAGLLTGINKVELWTALTLTRNYALTPSLWAFEHLWSLCIEEQFYLIWPTVLVLCMVGRGKTGRYRAARVAILVILAEPIVRLACFHFLPHFHNAAMFHMNADGLMFGSLGALLQGEDAFERIYTRVTRWPWLLPVLLFFVSGWLGTRFENYWNVPVGLTIDGFLVLMWLMWLVRNPDTWMGRVFNQPIVTWVGRLSYSLYLWQTFFLHHRSADVFGGDRWANTVPGAWLCILLAGVLSYYLVEQPALKLRNVIQRQLQRSSTSQKRDITA